MKIDSLMISEGPAIYFDLGFRNVLEDHMTYLRTHGQTRDQVVDKGAAYKYEYDLFGFLSMAGIAPHLHWVVMRMNNMTSPMEFGMHNETLLVPEATVVDKIRQAHMTTRKVT